jgi:ACS family hexuronate transporter-like MFS transporter
MSVAIPDNLVHTRSSAWKWWVCGLLLLATTLNYMDRLTLNLMSVRIMERFGLDAREYGRLESAFASAFAIGAIIAGWLADRINIRWLFALSVLAWSLAGFSTGMAQGFVSLLILRFLLGLAEAGNWPCALRTTQHILPPHERTMGNGLLQSGAAVGAVLTPLIVIPFIKFPQTIAAQQLAQSTGLPMSFIADSWRFPFLVIGAIGLVWVFLWLAGVRQHDLERHQNTANVTLMPVVGLLVLLFAVDVAVHVYFTEKHPPTTPADASFVPLIVKVVVTVLSISAVFLWLWYVTHDDREMDRRAFFRRFWVLALVTMIINGTWHYFRVWLPLYLQRVHGYSLEDTQWFMIAYYAATFVGSITAGFVTLRLAKGGLPIHWSRMLVFSACAVLCTLSVVAAYLNTGLLLLGVFLVIGFAALGMFPNYYTFSQEITVRHQGKLTGALGCICWLAMSLLQEVVGDSVERTHSYTTSVALAGVAPLLAVVVLLLFWGKTVVGPSPAVHVDADLALKLHTDAIQSTATVGVQK